MELVIIFRVEKARGLARNLFVERYSVVSASNLRVEMQMQRSTLLAELRERVLARIQRGPLLDISIGRSSQRFDLLELGNDEPKRAYVTLDAIISRKSTRLILPILEDEEADLSKEDIDANIAILKKIENIRRGVSLYQRETGVNPLYLAFPLLMLRERDIGTKPARSVVAPVLFGLSYSKRVARDKVR
jgi:primosomal replication protein N''